MYVNLKLSTRSIVDSVTTKNAKCRFRWEMTENIKILDVNSINLIL